MESIDDAISLFGNLLAGLVKSGRHGESLSFVYCMCIAGLYKLWYVCGRGYNLQGFFSF
jgi:hypothetical protein